MTMTLALTDTMTVAMFVVQMIVNVAVVLGMFWLKTRTEKLDNLETSLKRNTEMLVENRFEGVADKLKDILDRLTRGDGEFKSLGERDHRLELKFIDRLSELNQTLVERFASKAELDGLAKRFGRMQITCAERHGGNPFPQRTREEQETAIATFRKIYNSESKWPREYECQFTGDLSSLIPWAQLERAAQLGDGLPFDLIRVEGERPMGDLLQAIRTQVAAGARAEIGWDVARHKHMSSVWVNFAKHGQPKHLRFNVLMHGCPFDVQRQFVRTCMDVQSFSVGHGDATGLGMESNETLERHYRDRWAGFTFTATGKREIASALVTAFGDGGQALPPLSGATKYVATDLYAIQKDDTGANLIIEETPNGRAAGRTGDHAGEPAQHHPCSQRHGRAERF